MAKSSVLKAHALCWLRFNRKMPMVATEVGDWNADVLGVGDEFSVEVEVKVSKGDLMRELTSKAAKHFLYAAGAGGRHVPNYFYFFVPEPLAESAVQLVNEKAPKFGVVAWSEPNAPSTRFSIQSCRVAKKASTLHDKTPSAGLKRAILLRMGSELCGQHLYEIAWRDAVSEALESKGRQALEIIDKMQDWKYVEEDG